MSEEDIGKTIKSYGEATRLVHDRGFDGIEDHGDNHYLIQQFFSKLSNHRDDKRGGNLESRMNFPLAVVDEVKSVVGEFDDDFIVGYGISPEEIHGDNIGYDYKESISLISEIVKRDLDYIHLSLWRGFDDKPLTSDRTYAQIFKEAAKGTPIMIVSEIKDRSQVEKALELADIVAIGRASLLNPNFTELLNQGRYDEILTEIDPGKFADMKWPKDLKKWYEKPKTTLPPIKNLDSTKNLG